MITAIVQAAAAAAATETAGVSPTGSAAIIPVPRRTIARPTTPVRRAIPAAAIAGEATAAEVIDVTVLARETCDCACETRLFRLVPNWLRHQFGIA